MRRTLTATALAAGLIIASAGAAAANNSDVAQLHPGHAGYVASEGTGGGVPTAHFGAHGGPGYDSGPGGWGSAVSSTAQTYKGIPHAHG